MQRTNSGLSVSSSLVPVVTQDGSLQAGVSISGQRRRSSTGLASPPTPVRDSKDGMAPKQKRGGSAKGGSDVLPSQQGKSFTMQQQGSDNAQGKGASSGAAKEKKKKGRGKGGKKSKTGSASVALPPDLPASSVKGIDSSKVLMQSHSQQLSSPLTLRSSSPSPNQLPSRPSSAAANPRPSSPLLRPRLQAVSETGGLQLRGSSAGKRCMHRV